ncbi:hypothetical protein PENTCL1PPCAC_277, partial [Pristionchus entomophagus]
MTLGFIRSENLSPSLTMCSCSNSWSLITTMGWVIQIFFHSTYRYNFVYAEMAGDREEIGNVVVP